MKYLIFTDLDGTLLDHRTYSFEPALPALKLLRQRGIPLVFCSSKTAAEMIQLRRQTGNRDPFIVENGGGVYWPSGYFKRVHPPASRKGRFQVLSLGAGYRELVEFIEGYAERHNLPLSFYHEHSPEKLAEKVGFSVEESRRSLVREFDVPFEVPDEVDLGALDEEARRRGFRMTRGGRFYHLMGHPGKGPAVGRVIDFFRHEWSDSPFTVALGDSANDLEMLQEADLPIIIPNAQSGSALKDCIPGAQAAPCEGPEGWNEAIQLLLGVDSGP